MIVRGPFDIRWGNNVIQDVEEIDIEHTIDSEDISTVQGRTIELDGAFKVAVTLTLLSTDIPALAIVLPQHFVANGETLSTGETVTDEDGAIDVVSIDCDEELLFNNLDIIGCANPEQILRLVNTRSKMESVELTDKIRKIMVRFVGEAAQGQATIQMFTSGGISPVS